MPFYRVLLSLPAISIMAFSHAAQQPPVECADDARDAGQCLVTATVYRGWRTYHSACNHCHGPDALGSSFAPGLLDFSLREDFPAFKKVTENGYTGRLGVMPGYRDNPNINRYLEDIYQYLSARARDGLPRGRPARR